MRTISPGVAFLSFAVGIALRDIITERFFASDAACLAFLVISVIAGISGVMIIFDRQTASLAVKLRRPGVISRVLSLAAMAALIYGITFYMVTIRTAGVFDLLDYGIAPVLTAIIGLALLREMPGAHMLWSAMLFVAGMVMVGVGVDRVVFTGFWITLALLSPVATAISDASSKWLLTTGGLSRAEVLFCRFAPATAIFFVYIIGFHPGGLHSDKGALGFVVAAVLGFGPLYLLCTGLGRAGLTRYAAYEALIPAFVFFGSLPWHPENRTALAIAGALLVLLGVVIAEGSLVARFRKPADPTATPVEA